MCFEERSRGSLFKMHDREEGGPFIAGKITILERHIVNVRENGNGNALANMLI